ncbi:EOGT [Symbiodinium natans]|uniref:EOGT protein n=1 Tax=Symbiodinium natans TaxID=878477 RepID=A0A812N7X4_9DINO|nr:EOGT [Symbiodinium natans]
MNRSYILRFGWIIGSLAVSRKSVPKYLHLAKDLAALEDAECDSEVGLGRLRSYQGEGEELCTSGNSDASASFRCTAKWTKRSQTEAESGDYLCRGKGMKILLPQAGSKEPLQLYGQEGGCNWKLQHLQLDFFLWEGRDLKLDLRNGPTDAACDEDMGSSPVLLFSDEPSFWNPFISQAQVLMGYVSLAALDLDPKSLRMVVAVDEEDCCGAKAPLMGLLQGLFSQAGPSIRRKEKPQMICSNDVIVPTGGRNSFVRKNAGKEDPWASKCRNSPLVRGYGSFVRESFNVTSNPVQASTWRIALLSRKANSDHTGKFNREMTNVEEVVTGLKANGTEEAPTSLLEVAALQRSLESQGAQVTVLEMEALPIVDQVRAIANTDLLISAHSAALSWMMALPPCAQVLEICAAGNFQFINYAKLAGVEHHCVGPHIAWGTRTFKAPVSEMVRDALAAKERRDQCLQSVVS